MAYRKQKNTHINKQTDGRMKSLRKDFVHYFSTESKKS